MTDKKLSQLPAGAAIAPTDLFYSAQDIGGGNFTQVKQPASALSSFIGATGGGRTLLTTRTTFYVNASTGNDTTGTGAVGNPWLTLEHAANVLAQSYDLGGLIHTIKMQVAGTYAGFKFLTAFVGGGSIIFQGDDTSMAISKTYKINVAAESLSFNVKQQTVFYFSGCQIGNITAGGNEPINVQATTTVILGNPDTQLGYVTLGPVANQFMVHMDQDTGSWFSDEFCAQVDLQPTAGNQIGGYVETYSRCHVRVGWPYVGFGGVNIIGNPTITQSFIQCQEFSTVEFNGKNFVGTAVGQKYMFCDCVLLGMSSLAPAGSYPGIGAQIAAALANIPGSTAGSITGDVSFGNIFLPDSCSLSATAASNGYQQSLMGGL